MFDLSLLLQILTLKQKICILALFKALNRTLNTEIIINSFVVVCPKKKCIDFNELSPELTCKAAEKYCCCRIEELTGQPNLFLGECKLSVKEYV